MSRFTDRPPLLFRPPFVPLAADPTEDGRLRKAIGRSSPSASSLRLVTFALNFPLWGDEAFVAANFISRGYLDLLRPLDYSQICPSLFLWLELSAVKLFGFQEYSLRLVPTLASVASVFLFAHVAGRVTRGWWHVLAVAGVRDGVLPDPPRRGGEAVFHRLIHILNSLGPGDRMVATPRSRSLALGIDGRRSRRLGVVASGGLRRGRVQPRPRGAVWRDAALRCSSPFWRTTSAGGDVPRPLRRVHRRSTSAAPGNPSDELLGRAFPPGIVRWNWSSGWLRRTPDACSPTHSAAR